MVGISNCVSAPEICKGTPGPWDTSPVPGTGHQSSLTAPSFCVAGIDEPSLREAETPVLVLAPLQPKPAASSCSFSQELKEAFNLLQQPRQKG